jgi:hypothetical protein
LPFLTRSDLVFRHLISLRRLERSRASRSIVGSDATGITNYDPRRPGNSSQQSSNPRLAFTAAPYGGNQGQIAGARAVPSTTAALACCL